MFSVMKAKIAAGFAFIVAAMAVYIKILKKRNKRKAEEIQNLKRNAEIEKEKKKHDVRRERFNAVQKDRVLDADNFDSVNNADKDRGKIDEKDNFTTVSR